MICNISFSKIEVVGNIHEILNCWRFIKDYISY